MPIRKQKPRSPGVRFQTISGFDEITKSEPEKNLLVSISRSGGRNNNCLLYTSPSPRDRSLSRMPSSA